MFEIYEVPAQELDGSEEYLDGVETLQEAYELYDELLHSYNEHRNLWLIKCSDEKGYEHVYRT